MLAVPGKAIITRKKCFWSEIEQDCGSHHVDDWGSKDYMITSADKLLQMIKDFFLSLRWYHPRSLSAIVILKFLAFCFRISGANIRVLCYLQMCSCYIHSFKVRPATYFYWKWNLEKVYDWNFTMVFGKEADEFKPSKDIGKYETIVITQLIWLETVCENLRVSFDQPNFFSETRRKWRFWLSAHLTLDRFDIPNAWLVWF